MKTKFLKLIRAAFVLLVFVIFAAVAVFSAENKGSLLVKLVKPDVEVKIFKVADGDSLSGEFKDYPVSLGDSGAAQALAAYAVRDGLTPYRQGMTDESYEARFDDLPPGHYLVVAENVIADDKKYVFMPTIMSIGGDFVQADEKYEAISLVDDKGEPIKKDLGVMKVWNNSEGESSVTAQLLRNGEIYDEVVLDKSNSWRYVWKNLEVSYDWQIIEKAVPASFRVSVDIDGGVYVINNYYDEDSPGMEEPTTQPTTQSQSGGGEKETETVREAQTEETTEKTKKYSGGKSYNVGGGEGETKKPSSEPNNNEEPPATEEETVETTEEETLTVTQAPDETTEKGVDVTTGEKLPQTGQLWVPVPVMAFAGIILILLGIIERQKENDNEKK